MTAHTPGRVHGLHMTPEQLSFGDKLRPHRTPRSLVPPRAYHVSSPRTTVEEAREGERRARGQEAVILQLFRVHEGERLTPSDVTHKLNVGRAGRPFLLGSVRRALTNMTERRELTHHALDRRPSPNGGLESCWSLAE